MFLKGRRLHRCPEGEERAQCVTGLEKERGSREEKMSLKRWAKEEGRLLCTRKRGESGRKIGEEEGKGRAKGRRGRAATQGGRGSGSGREEGLFVDH